MSSTAARRRRPTAALAVARKHVTLDSSVAIPKQLGTGAFATDSNAPEYLLVWQAGSRVAITAIDVDVRGIGQQRRPDRGGSVRRSPRARPSAPPPSSRTRSISSALRPVRPAPRSLAPGAIAAEGRSGASGSVPPEIGTVGDRDRTPGERMEVGVYKVIVVGTDGSERAAVAVGEALALAKVTGASVHGVHVMRPVLMTGTEFDVAAVEVSERRRHDEADRVGAEFLAEAERHGVTAEIATFDGDPADAIIKAAEAVHADLIVVGNRGMAGVRRFVLGSVPEQGRAPLPLQPPDRRHRPRLTPTRLRPRLRRPTAAARVGDRRCPIRQPADPARDQAGGGPSSEGWKRRRGLAARRELGQQRGGGLGHLAHRQLEGGAVVADVVCTPLTLRTYWRAAASISSAVASGSRPRSVVMFRHMRYRLRRPVGGRTGVRCRRG